MAKTLRSHLSWVLLFLFWSFIPTYAQPTLVLHSGDVTDIGRNSVVSLDNTNMIPVADIAAGRYDSLFTRHDRQFICYGITNGASWVRFRIANPDQADVYVSVGLPTLDSAKLFRIVNGQPVLLGVQGIRPPYTRRQINTQEFMFNLGLRQDTATYLLRVSESRAHFYTLKAGPLTDLLPRAGRLTLVFAINIGLLLMLSLYNLFLYLTLRDKAYLYYVAYNLAYLLFFAQISGIWQVYGAFVQPVIDHCDTVFSSGTLFFGGLFTMAFLNLRQYSELYYRVMMLLTVLVGSMIALAVFGANETAFQLIPGISILLLGGEIAATLYVMRRGYTPARLFLVGWGTAAVAVIGYILGLYRVYNFTAATAHIPELASTFEAIIFSYALAVRVNKYRQEKEDLILSQNVMLETKVTERTAELNQQKVETEKLLLNILPSDVAAELKSKGTADARFFNDVTVLFTDFKGFTTVAERLTPQQLVDELHQCFKGFDEIVGRYGIEKIKTVGDAYLAAAGVPNALEAHALVMVQAATEIRDFMSERRRQIGENTFEVRIGIHTGSVVAGIVGVKKFAYDIWGDTVNTAARMEQNSEPGKINISQSTWELVHEKFSCTYRGKVAAKNKGELNMYFVD